MNATELGDVPSGLVHVTAETPIDEMLAIYLRDGGLIIDGLLDEDTVASVREELKGLIEPTLQEQAQSSDTEQFYGDRDDFLGSKTARAGALIAEAPACRPLAMHPLILELLSQIFETGYQLNAVVSMSVLPGETAQPLHRDRDIWKTLPLPHEFERVVNCLWAIENVTADAGATRVIPRSMDFPDYEFGELQYDKDGEVTRPDGTKLSDHRIVPAEMSDGSALVYGGAVYHGAGANETDQARLVMATAYASDALRQQENQYLIAPPEIARELPETLQKLLGYEIAEPYIGFVRNMNSPMSLLD